MLFRRVCSTLCILSLCPACASTSSSQTSTTDTSSGATTSTGSTNATGSSNGTSTTPGGTSSANTSATGASSTSSATGNTSSSSSTGSGQTCSAAVCDSFESATAGGPPKSNLWTLFGTGGCSGQGNPSAPVVFPIKIDNTQHHSGSQSLSVKGGDTCGPMAVNTSAFSGLSSGEVYARFFVKLDATQSFHHAFLATGGLVAATDGGVGFTSDQSTFLGLDPENVSGSEVLYWAVTDSHTIPAQNSTAAATSTYFSGTDFSCVEFHVSGSQKTIETWINGTAVAGLTSPPPSVQGSWPPPTMTLTSLGLGWMSTDGTSSSAFPVWFDDVAISSTRIGCSCACP